MNFSLSLRSFFVTLSVSDPLLWADENKIDNRCRCKVNGSSPQNGDLYFKTLICTIPRYQMSLHLLLMSGARRSDKWPTVHAGGKIFCLLLLHVLH